VTRALRFCMFATYYPPYNYGGDGITLQRLCRALVRDGHEVTVVHDADAFTSLGHPEPTPAPPADDGIEVVTLRSSLGRLSLLLTYEMGRPVVHGKEIADLLRARRFDVVHFHNVSLVGGPGLFPLARDSATIYTAHEHWLVCPTHVLWRFGRERCTGRKCVRCTLSYGRPPQLWRNTGLLERSLEYVDTFIALSEFSRAKHREFGFAREMEVLPPIVFDADVDESAVPAAQHPRPYFFFAGRLERIKGLDDVIPLFRDGAVPGDLLIAGAGSHEPALRALAADAPTVQFLGRVESERLAPLYRHAIAHIAPSVCFETFGNTLVESFRQGTPVVARKIGPFPELVAHAKAGELFEDQRSLRRALELLATSTAYRDRLGRAGRDAYEATWSEAAIVPRYLDIVERTIARRRPAATVGVPAVPVT
jgi:glycosyltransferase involved in cell wall biosynthesis